MHFQDSKRVIDSWIIAVKEIFVSVIVSGEIPVTNMSSIQMTTLYAGIKKSETETVENLKRTTLQATYNELSSTK